MVFLYLLRAPPRTEITPSSGDVNDKVAIAKAMRIVTSPVHGYAQYVSNPLESGAHGHT